MFCTATTSHSMQTSLREEMLAIILVVKSSNTNTFLPSVLLRTSSKIKYFIRARSTISEYLSFSSNYGKMLPGKENTSIHTVVFGKEASIIRPFRTRFTHFPKLCLDHGGLRYENLFDKCNKKCRQPVSEINISFCILFVVFVNTELELFLIHILKQDFAKLKKKDRSIFSYRDYLYLQSTDGIKSFHFFIATF